MLNQDWEWHFAYQRKHFSKQKCYLCTVFIHTESPDGQRLGRHIYIKGVTVRFGFDAIRTSQLQTDCQKQSNGNASWGVLYTAIIGFGRFFRPLSRRMIYIFTLAWGFRRCISVVHSKMIFLICYLLDYQQIHENTNVSIILLGDKKEPTKWKTNPVQQILLPNNHFPCYFYFKNHFYWRKEKRCVTCLWLPTKANTQI